MDLLVLRQESAVYRLEGTLVADEGTLLGVLSYDVKVEPFPEPEPHSAGLAGEASDPLGEVLYAPPCRCILRKDRKSITWKMGQLS